MQIIHIIDSLLDKSAGPTQSVVSLANQQSIHGQEVTVITLGAELDKSYNFSLVNIAPYRNLFMLFWTTWLRYLLGQSFAATKCKKTVIHLHGIWRPLVNFPLILIWPPTTRIISSPRGMLMKPAMANKKLKKRVFWFLLQKWLLYKVNAFHTTGPLEKESCQYFFPKKGCFVVKNGINVHEEWYSNLSVGNSRENVNFGFLGRIHPIKNIDILIKSWSILPEVANKCKLVICGPDRENHLSYLKSLVGEFGTKNIDFWGEAHEAEKEFFFNKIDCLILPSKSENFGMVVAEALACGIPVICSSQAPWAVLNEKQIGWSIPICVERLSETINEAYTNRAALKEMGLRGRAYAIETLSWPVITKQMNFQYTRCFVND